MYLQHKIIEHNSLHGQDAVISVYLANRLNQLEFVGILFPTFLWAVLISQSFFFFLTLVSLTLFCIFNFFSGFKTSDITMAIAAVFVEKMTFVVSVPIFATHIGLNSAETCLKMYYKSTY